MSDYKNASELQPYLTCEACGVHYPVGAPGSYIDDEQCHLCPACAAELKSQLEEEAAENEEGALRETTRETGKLSSLNP